ncbi:MAG: hypothetical protein PUA81_03115 [Oscillospiraceae bacterium]|nr:hypothetical protein [Oscillospiraceae bacterium]
MYIRTVNSIKPVNMKEAVLRKSLVEFTKQYFCTIKSSNQM